MRLLLLWKGDEAEAEMRSPLRFRCAGGAEKLLERRLDWLLDVVAQTETFRRRYAFHSDRHSLVSGVLLAKIPSDRPSGQKLQVAAFECDAAASASKLINETVVARTAPTGSSTCGSQLEGGEGGPGGRRAPRKRQAALVFR